MKIQQVMTTVNQMKADGIIERYAIGGAVGATFYLEPVATLDVDIFVTFESEPGQLLLTLRPIFDYLTARAVRLKANIFTSRAGQCSFCRQPMLWLKKHWRKQAKSTWMECLLRSFLPNIWPLSLCKPDGPKTRRVC